MRPRAPGASGRPDERGVTASDVWTLLLLACGDPEPVLQAVEPARTPAQVAEARAAAELRTTPRNAEVTYTKAEGVYVDAFFLGGRRYDAVRAEIEHQLGALVEERPGEGKIVELLFERGTLRLHDGAVHMVEVPLPEPVRRTEALGLLGFPPAVQEYKSFALEFRLLNERGFRRIRLFRQERGSEDIVRVQAWKFADSDR
jgi:hypothetical protein